MDGSEFWSIDNEIQIKDIKVKRSNMEELAGMCFATMSDIFKLLLDNIPSGETEDAATCSLDTLARLINVISDYEKYLNGLLVDLEGKKKYLEMIFKAEDEGEGADADADADANGGDCDEG